MTSSPRLVVAAMDRELRPLAKAMGWRRGGPGRRGYVGDRIVAGVIGVGVPAEKALGELLSRSSANEVLLVGISGALTNDLLVGTSYTTDLVCTQDERYTLQPVPHLQSVALTSVKHLGDPPFDGAQMVDMEGIPAARAANAHGATLRIIRAISDAPGELPNWIETLLREDGGTNWLGLLRVLFSRPTRIVTLIAMGRQGSRAIAAMTKAAVAYLRESSPTP